MCLICLHTTTDAILWLNAKAQHWTFSSHLVSICVSMMHLLIIPTDITVGKRPVTQVHTEPVDITYLCRAGTLGTEYGPCSVSLGLLKTHSQPK